MLARPCPLAPARASALLLSVLVPLACTGYTDSTDPDQESSLGGIERWEVVSPEAWGQGDGPSDELMTDPGELPRFHLPDGSLMPLRHTHVDADLHGPFAEVLVTQTFENTGEGAIEAIYHFPLPQNSAVSRLRMRVGERVIEGEIRERQQARAIYERARKNGFLTSLLEQQRPNVFTQSLANIPPGASVDVEVTYHQSLSFDAGEYEFVFPMVVGPRFTSPQGPTHSSLGATPTPPVVPPGVTTGHNISLDVHAQTGFPIATWRSPSHKINADTYDGELRVTLADTDEQPNRDFILRYRAVGDRPRATMHVAEDGEYFMLVVHPPQLDVAKLVGQREFVFVIDVSGSMYGQPLALAKRAVRQTLTHLRPVDRFNVMTFASSTATLFEQPKPATSATLKQALDFIDGVSAGGGTMMSDAVDKALAPSGDARHRYVFFLTDGYISGEDEIYRQAKNLTRLAADKGLRARVFGLGMGSAPNRHLIEVLSRAGSGVPLYVANREDPARAVSMFKRYVDHAVVTDMELFGADFVAQSVLPKQSPDLFASHPAILHGRAESQPKKSLWIRGRVGARPIKIPVQVVRAGANDTVLSTLWARAKIVELEAELWEQHADELVRQITSLGLEHHLVTAYTSLIAVDLSTRTATGDPKLVVQGVDIPDGLNATTAGAVVLPGSEAAGITLAGTTGAESRYSVDGANVSNPSFGTASTSIVQEYVEGNEASLTSDFIGVVEPNAWVRVKRARGDDRGVRTLLKQHRGTLGDCAELVGRDAQRLRRKLTVNLRFDAHGALTDVSITKGTLGDEQADACLVSRIEALDFTNLEGQTGELSFDLVVWMQH